MVILSCRGFWKKEAITDNNADTLVYTDQRINADNFEDRREMSEDRF